MLAKDVVFYVGDILHDEALQDIGVLLECYDSLEEYRDGSSFYSYGVVVSMEPFDDQLSLFPAVMVFSFVHGIERQYYPYNLEIISSTA